MQKKYVFLLMILSIFITLLFCNNIYASSYFRLNNFTPQLTSKNSLIHLQQPVNNNKLIDYENFEEEYSFFALGNYDIFRQSLSDFLFASEKKNDFLVYQIVDNKLHGKLQINLIGGIDYHTNFDEQYLHPYRRVRIRGNINNRFLLWADWWAGRFQGDLDYAEDTSPLIRGWHKSHTNEGQKYTNLNRLSGQMSYLFDFGSVSLGRGRHTIGDNISGSIVLNDDTNEYGYIKGHLSFGKLKMSLLHASLIPDKDDPVYSALHGIHYVDKYLALHQIDYSVNNNLNLYFGEQVIYGNRNIDINYLLPHTFYRIIEHNQRDRDNVLIYGGFRWEINNPISIYGSFILDELRKSEMLGNWWGNKYALQSGISLQYLKGLMHNENDYLHTTFEFTAVRPWMYTHKTPYTDFSHDGFGLGFPGGSNLIQGATEIILPILPYLKYNQFISFTRQGSWGNSWDLHYDKDRKVDGVYQDTADWLEGNITETFRTKAVVSFSLLEHHSIKAGMEWVKENSREWQKELVLSYQFYY